VSTPARDAERPGRGGTGLRLAPRPVDDALDGLVATVDDLVRDLAEPERTEPSVGPAPGRTGGATLREKGAVCLVVLAVLALELVVVSWLVSNM
jgi:hypothetical protein